MASSISHESAVVDARYNRWSIAALMLAVVCLVALVFTGVAVLAVFAVGAGHIALGQLRAQGGRGRGLARAALAIGYAIGIWALLITAVGLVGWAIT
ncbi:hypothetical protein [Arthrobacter sp. JSM 101049]|uniref:hypothetical protein n=1 Tax=Arthrobacter sp. JSM 101049 TaxID=929097 RepID=UPI0035640A18